MDIEMFAALLNRTQNTQWYHAFLQPVAAQIPPQSRVLDIGTGPGQLLETLWREKGITGAGVDTSKRMIKMARARLKGTSLELQLTGVNDLLPYPPASFDAVTLCNVLFGLGDTERNELLNQASRLLRPGGRILSLTPTGNRALTELLQSQPSWPHWSIIPWYLSTRKAGKHWTHSDYLLKFSRSNGYHYQQNVVFSGFAVLETLQDISSQNPTKG
jgi:SAM-dependent methyltransferase